MGEFLSGARALSLSHTFKTTVEAAGGIFLRLENGTVFFCARPGDKELSLYAFACTRETVSLSLKAFHEKLAIDQWESLV
jgi:hypothetical protein